MPKLKIGGFELNSNLALAPMAGVTDRPFRILCKSLGAGLAASEMVVANAALAGAAPTLRRMDHRGEPGPRMVQIAGADPQMLANTAKLNVDSGAQMIDINMGCPAKRICRALAGSALLCDEPLVARILHAVVSAVPVPVTLKIRTGPDGSNRNGVTIARIAQESGVQALAVHGRTRADRFNGCAEYDTIAAIKAAIDIPVFANGDIRTPQDARRVLDYTGADGIMVGRAAQGNPWIFRQITHYLETGSVAPPPTRLEVSEVLLAHVRQLHQFYGGRTGVLVARKHISWYCKSHPSSANFRRTIQTIDCRELQLQMVQDYFQGDNYLMAQVA